jgi:hypothetical protein
MNWKERICLVLGIVLWSSYAVTSIVVPSQPPQSMPSKPTPQPTPQPMPQPTPQPMPPPSSPQRRPSPMPRQCPPLINFPTQCRIMSQCSVWWVELMKSPQSICTNQVESPNWRACCPAIVGGRSK